MNIVIVDDHKVLAEGLAELIEKNTSVKVDAIFSNGFDVLFYLKNHTPDLIILDIDMPDISGAVLAKEILSKYKKVKIMILTMHTEATYFEQLFNIGIVGYLNKSASKNEVFEALNTINNGKTYYGREVITEYINAQKEVKPNLEPEDSIITQREKEVLKLIIEGLTTTEMSEKLFVSKYTIDSHRRNLLAKLDVKNTADLVRLAIEKHLV